VKIPSYVRSDFTRKAAKAELLDAETEADLARAWRDERDEQALHRLVTAYLRLAISMAAKYRAYSLPVNDLIQEASVGLMKAASKFDPDRGVRFSTYAIWWIKASIQEYLMRNWSLVRTGSTTAQKSLFFKMRRVKAKIEAEMQLYGIGAEAHEIRAEIARDLGVPLRDVDMMEARLSGADFSLNATQAGEDGLEWVETLEDDAPQAQDKVSRQSDLDFARGLLDDAFDALNERESMIVEARRLAEQPETLESLGLKLSVSKERVRQLEVGALSKMRRRLETSHGTAAAELAASI
jgi:RNA polymerase sigma-32 factor